MGENIRNIELQDYKELIPLWKKTSGVRVTVWDQPKLFARFVVQSKETSFVFELDGQIIGSCLCGFDGLHSYIYHFAILPEQQKKGYGEKLLGKCLEKLKEKRIFTVHLFTEADNADAIKFFCKNGFDLRKDIAVLTKIVK